MHWSICYVSPRPSMEGGAQSDRKNAELRIRKVFCKKGKTANLFTDFAARAESE